MAIPGRHPGRLLLWVLVTAFITATVDSHLDADQGQLTRHKRQHPDSRTSFILTDFIGVPDPEADVISLQSTRETGKWSDWSEPSECSRTCGGGVSSQSRECLGRGAQDADERSDSSDTQCVGATKRHHSCNIQECPADTQDFRSEQCSRFNGVPFENRYYEWVPYTRAPNKCELNCMPKGERFYYRHRRKVIDGTRCDEQEGTDVCVAGQCLPVGCDSMLGSTAKEDQCRVCGGDGTTCTSVQGIAQQNDFQTGYNDVLLIPVGATNIKIREVKSSNNYLAIRNTTGHYYLNGNWRIDFPREMKFAGCTFHYERKPHAFIAPETITALGPTTEALYVVLLYQEPNPGIEYEYSFPKDVSLPTGGDSYSWIYGAWSDCNADCGGGIQTRNVSCAKTSDFEMVSDDLCDPQLQPSVNRTCATDACDPSWFIGNWTKCSSNCQAGIQFRTVYCQQVIAGSMQSVINDSVCVNAIGPTPSSIQECNKEAVCPQFHIGEWGPCDKLCGDGTRQRKVTCFRKTDDRIEQLADSDCEGDVPARTESCFKRPCEGVDWITSPWSGCKDKCGLEYETRRAQCVSPKGKIYPDEFCHAYRRPALNRTCADATPCKYVWFASQWSACSSDCGAGIQSRWVFCGTMDGGVPAKVDDENCDPAQRYDNTTECHVPPDQCKGVWFSGPWSECSKTCGSGSRTRPILCLANNETADIKQCGVDTIPSAEEKCNTQACSEEAAPEGTTETPLVEVCEEVDEEGDEEEIRESKSKRQKLDPAEMVMRRREKRLWHEKRKEILFNYMQFSFYSSSTALLMFELAWKLSRDSNDLLWWAIIGVGEQQLLGKVDSKTSVLDNGKLQSHMIRLAHLSQHGGDSAGTKDALYITHEKDLSLSMYRHWSLLESLKYTPQTASHFHLWTLKGEKKLNEFLAELGLPLSQCRQKYNSMDIELRNDLRSIFQKKVEKYDLEDLIEYSFNSQYGFRPKNSASDFVFALLALLDSAERDKDPADAFHDALECLSNSKMDAVYRGIELAKLQQMAIGKEVHTCLDMGHVINAGPCLYAVIQDGTPDAKYYGHPHSLLMLGQFLLKAHISRARGRGLRARELPLIISAPSATRPSHCLLLGLPPLSLDSPKNLIGKAFEQAAENTQTEITSVFFDSSVIEINSEFRSNFLDSLFSLLE